MVEEVSERVRERACRKKGRMKRGGKVSDVEMATFRKRPRAREERDG